MREFKLWRRLLGGKTEPFSLSIEVIGSQKELETIQKLVTDAVVEGAV